MANKYWMCVIEVEDSDSKIPDGFDSPPRVAASKAVEKGFVPVVNCWSGWGTREKRINEIMDLWNKDQDDGVKLEKGKS